MHQKINNNKKESLEKKYKSASTGCLNAIIGILFALFILYILATAVPGFLAYRDRGRIVRIPSIAKEIQTALKTYAEKHPARLYPENIPNYEALRMIVSKQGGAIPEKQSEAVIGNIQYESENGNNYILIVEGDVNSENRFFLVTPDGVTKFLRAYSKTSPDIKKITNMQIMKLLTNIDRNLINKEIDGVFDSYAPSAKLNIRHTIIRSGEKDRKICFSDLESYKNSLKETFTRSSSFSRKREDIYIKLSTHDIEVGSGIIEIGKIDEENYKKEIREIYNIQIIDKRLLITNDNSFAFIYYKNKEGDAQKRSN